MTNNNIYLGTRVPDIGKPGLDRITEVDGICKAILEDYRRRRITYRTAMSRLNLLSLIVSRDDDFDSVHPRKKAKALRIIDEYRSKLMKMRNRNSR